MLHSRWQLVCQCQSNHPKKSARVMRKCDSGRHAGNNRLHSSHRHFPMCVCVCVCAGSISAVCEAFLEENKCPLCWAKKKKKGFRIVVVVSYFPGLLVCDSPGCWDCATWNSRLLPVLLRMRCIVFLCVSSLRPFTAGLDIWTGSQHSYIKVRAEREMKVGGGGEREWQIFTSSIISQWQSTDLR
jgi:hypothetical protein